MKKQRMYTIVMRHLSGIQKGIQASHAISNSYQPKYGESPEYKRWAKTDQTLIVLETHTTDALEKAKKRLARIGIKVADFKEPDLANATTAIAFLVDETVWDKGKYPEASDYKSAFLRDFLPRFSLASN